MGTSTNAYLCYGYSLDEDKQYPWESDDYDEDFEAWYYKEVLGYKEPFEYSEDLTEEETKNYFAHKRAFQKENPMPFEMVIHCHCEYPMYILAVKLIKAWRGDVVEITSLDVDENKVKQLTAFMKEYNLIGDEDSPSWLLCSYWK